jgi:hypothetical protein
MNLEHGAQELEEGVPSRCINIMHFKKASAAWLCIFLCILAHLQQSMASPVPYPPFKAEHRQRPSSPPAGERSSFRPCCIELVEEERGYGDLHESGH